jgi:hypothetical protein
MGRSETWQHRNLKRLAAQWAHANGFRCIGMEVRAPRSRFRVDVVAYRSGRISESGEPLIAIFECKQSRPDLCRDIAQIETLQRELHYLQQRRAKLEELLWVHHPSLRRGESLFPEWDTFAGELLAHAGYQRLVARIIRVQSGLHDSTKFAWIARHRLANLHYLVAPDKLASLDELPPGWGLLESNGSVGLSLCRPPQLMRILNAASWLERIGQSATNRWLRQEGLIGRSESSQPMLEL